MARLACGFTPRVVAAVLLDVCAGIGCNAGIVDGPRSRTPPDDCAGVTCSGHGTCAVGPAGPECACAEGYHASGLECLTVADPCAGVSCSGHGACAVGPAGPECACAEGYHASGLACVALAGPCAGVTCAGRGTCTTSGGAVSCSCDSGFHADGLFCVRDADPCAGLTCSGHGACHVDGGAPTCTCDPGYDLAGLACLPMGVSGVTTHGLTIVEGHPRLWLTPDRLERARTWFAASPFTPAGDIWLQLAFAAQVTADHTDRTRWCDLAIDNALARSAAIPLSGTACDTCRWYGEDIILTYDWCYDVLVARNQRDTLIASVNAWLEHWRTQAWGGPQMPQNNYFWGYLRNELEWGIATYFENTAAAEVFLEDALVRRWQEGFAPTATASNAGGVLQEGAQYGRYIAHYPVIPFVSSRLGGRDLYDETAFFRSAVVNLLYQTLPARTTSVVYGTTGWELFPFCDDEQSRYGNAALARQFSQNPGSYFGDFMQTMAGQWPTTAVGGWAQQWVDMTGAAAFVSYWLRPFAGATVARPLASLPFDYHAAGIGFVYGRTAWDGESAVLHMQLGYPTGVGHEHSDFGNWQLWRGGRWLSRETTTYGEGVAGFGGAGTAGGATTIAHNGIVINPDSQGCVPNSTCTHAGSAGYAHDDTNGVPVLRRLMSHPGFLFANVDLSLAYRNDIKNGNHPERDNPGARHVERDFVYVRDLETLVIVDRLETNPVGSVPAAEIRKTFVAHCERDWTMDDAQRSTCSPGGGQELRLTTLIPATTSRTSVDEGGSIGQFRLEVTTAGAPQSHLVHVLQARASAGLAVLAPSVTETATTFVVTLDASHALTFNKGMTSTGGSVTLAGEVTPLRADVQRLTVTEDGPFWE